MSDVLTAVRARLREHFAAAGVTGDPVAANVTFLGAEPMEVLRFGADDDGVYHYVSVGCSRHPMMDPMEFVADASTGPRAEVVLSQRGPTPAGLAKSIAVVASTPSIEGVILVEDALIDLETPLWEGAPFTAVLLAGSDIEDVDVGGDHPVTVLSATPITATEAAWVRLKGADAMREAWLTDGVDVRDPRRRAASPS
ncbi:suppressor of fused domain protein [Mycolicibacterium lacusdiani]|uniref:suppressor of fused domain protein n=1 Tax=Mycolicibacterium lacusdiani TaxID=2895283 RepID=UPI001F2626DE|nr:suppressor of fused domain protein [Mycolicibacterium lacusdiani]